VRDLLRTPAFCQKRYLAKMSCTLLNTYDVAMQVGSVLLPEKWCEVFLDNRPPLAGYRHPQLDATQARHGLTRSPEWPARNTTVWHH
jgi:hypothetical protein